MTLTKLKPFIPPAARRPTTDPVKAVNDAVDTCVAAANLQKPTAAQTWAAINAFKFADVATQNQPVDVAVQNKLGAAGLACIEVCIHGAEVAASRGDRATAVEFLRNAQMLLERARRDGWDPELRKQLQTMYDEVTELVSSSYEPPKAALVDLTGRGSVH